MKKKTNALHRGRTTLSALVITSVMTALSIVLCRFAGFSTVILRFELGFLPIALVGALFGPVYSGAGYVAADLLGQLIFPAGSAGINPAITLCKLATGLLLGFGFHNKKTDIRRTIAVFAVINVFVDFLSMSCVFILWFGYTAREAFLMRAINAGLTLPLRILVYHLIAVALNDPMNRLRRTLGIPVAGAKNTFAAYANAFQAVTVPGLSRIDALLERLGRPERTLKCLHVAGTNGKGSVCAYLANGLEEAGFRVGKYISPNLIKVNERISVNGKDISDRDMNALLAEIAPLSEDVEKALGIAPTPFEVWTAAAMVYFARQHVDYAVIEVGLGGEFDATNVIPRHEIAIITRLGMDHMQYLGNTITDIAHAKAGILKEDSTTHTLVTVEQEPAAMEVLRARCEELHLRMEVVHPVSVRTEGVREVFSWEGHEYLAGIPGYHQIENAALAVSALHALGVEEGAIARGLARTVHPARFEILSEQPTVIYDGGHNENGITALTQSLERYFPGEKKNVIFACMGDKEIEASLKRLAPGTDTFFFTTVKDNPRAMSAEALTGRAAAYGIHGIACPDIGTAYERACATGELCLICGSLYLYKDLMTYLRREA